MNFAFYLAAVVAVFATIKVITGLNAVHALIYMILSLLSVAIIFYTLGATFIAALEVIIYAGAIMVLFVFAVMMLNLGPQTIAQERSWLNLRMWIFPSLLALVLLGELIYIFITTQAGGGSAPVAVGPKPVSLALFGPYLIGVELASILLLAGLVGAYHLGSARKREEEEFTGLDK